MPLGRLIALISNAHLSGPSCLRSNDPASAWVTIARKTRSHRDKPRRLPRSRQSALQRCQHSARHLKAYPLFTM